MSREDEDFFMDPQCPWKNRLNYVYEPEVKSTQTRVTVNNFTVKLLSELPFDGLTCVFVVCSVFLSLIAVEKEVRDEYMF